jgi:pyruvate,water dikinase
MVESTLARPDPHFEDWNRDIAAGLTYTYDPMHFPHPVTPLTATTSGPCFAIGSIAAFRELQAPLERIDVIHRNHFRFECWTPIVPANDAEARAQGEAAERLSRVEVGRMMDRWHGEHLPRISALHRRLRELNVETANPAELLNLLDEVDAIHTEVWTIHFRVAMPMLLAMQLFDEMYADLFDGTDADAHALLVGGLSESVKAGIGLSDLAALAVDLGMRDLFLQTTPVELEARLQNTSTGRTFLARLGTYLETYGLRQDLFEFSTPTWQEDPSIALASIRSYIQTGHDARAGHEARARSAERARSEARERLASYPEAIRTGFEAMVQFGRQGAFLQEEHNFCIDQRAMALIRLVYVRVGRRLVDAGLLRSPDDVFLLTSHDIRHVIGRRFRIPASTVQALVDDRRQSLAAAWELTPPPFLGEPPAGPPPQDNPMQRASARFFGRLTSDPVEDVTQLIGNGGSRGVATGIARVARTLDEARALVPGEILVTVTTLPAWTPLFGVAAAVVTETGGPLSHCAIVAREYGMPAVVGAPGATRRIRTGQTITRSTAAPVS